MFRAQHDTLGDCAVKVYSPESEPRVIAEVDFLSDLSHPGIVSILEYGSVDVAGMAYPYTIMPMVGGGSLQHRIDSHAALDENEAKSLVRGVTDAIAVLWGARKVHRDIKPENILLPPGGPPVLIDFGVVRHLDLSTMTVTGGAPGTSGYKSPEQSAGIRSLTYKSDVFSLGLCVYYGISGVHPFQRRQDLIDAGVQPPSLTSLVACSPRFAMLLTQMMHPRAVMRASLPEVYSMLD